MEKGSRTKNYYEILELRQDCTDKEVRNAFVKLSKEFHPDVRGPKSNAKDTAHFVKISEAYHTLSKPNLRKNYDHSLQAACSTSVDNKETSFNSTIHRPWAIKPEDNPNPGPYYGIKGFNKISNTKIAIALLTIGLIGGVTGISIVKNSFAYKQSRLDKISEKAHAHHKKVRDEVEKFGKEEQLRRVIQRIKKTNQR